MLSWRTARRTSGICVPATSGRRAVLLPSTAQADGDRGHRRRPGCCRTAAGGRRGRQGRQARDPHWVVTQGRQAARAPMSRREPDHAGANAVVGDLVQTGSRPFSMFGVTWKGGLPEQRHGRRGALAHEGTWTAWTELHVDRSPGRRWSTRHRSRNGSVRPTALPCESSSTSDARPKDLALTLVDAITTSSATASTRARHRPEPIDVTPAATVDKPAIILRASWGAAAVEPCDSPRYGSTTRGAVIHHTAGCNYYTKAESAGIVKASRPIT